MIIKLISFSEVCVLVVIISYPKRFQCTIYTDGMSTNYAQASVCYGAGIEKHTLDFHSRQKADFVELTVVFSNMSFRPD
jgi:hypothetical protein